MGSSKPKCEPHLEMGVWRRARLSMGRRAEKMRRKRKRGRVSFLPKNGEQVFLFWTFLAAFSLTLPVARLLKSNTLHWSGWKALQHRSTFQLSSKLDSLGRFWKVLAGRSWQKLEGFGSKNLEGFGIFGQEGFVRSWKDLESFGSFWWKGFGTFWNILAHLGTFWNILEYLGKFWNGLERVKLMILILALNLIQPACSARLRRLLQTPSPEIREGTDYEGGL